LEELVLLGALARGGCPWGSVKEKSGHGQPWLVTSGQEAGLAMYYKKEALWQGEEAIS